MSMNAALIENDTFEIQICHAPNTGCAKIRAICVCPWSVKLEIECFCEHVFENASCNFVYVNW